jgi:hypothetical protein
MTLRVLLSRLSVVLIVLVATIGVAAPPCAAGEFKLNLGGGFGIPYSGVAGGTVELEGDLGDDFSLVPSLGLGHTVLADFGWDVGLKALFLPSDALFRVGPAVYYGTNVLIEDPHDDWKSETGLSFGVTGRLQFGSSRKHCVDFYILYPQTDYDEDYYEEQGSSIKVAVGYVLHFR